MAISKNLLTQGIRGAIGKQIVFRVYGSKQVVSAYPDMSERKLSPAQLRHNKIMKQANAELKKIKADKKRRDAAQLRLNVTSNKLHHALLSELLLKYGNLKR
jgi:hypothetical protein